MGGLSAQKWICTYLEHIYRYLRLSVIRRCPTLPQFMQLHAEQPFRTQIMNSFKKNRRNTKLETNDVHFSLKELLEHFAEIRGISFAPKPHKILDGLQIYSFGTTNMVIDVPKQVLRVQVK